MVRVFKSQISIYMNLIVVDICDLKKGVGRKGETGESSSNYIECVQENLGIGNSTNGETGNNNGGTDFGTGKKP